MNYSTKEFRKNNFYMLYDLNDNIISYLDNPDELERFTNVPFYRIVFNFKKNSDYILIYVDGRLCKLYTFLKN